MLTIMDVSEKEDAPLYGCAIDIGTTTVTGVLMDLKTGTLTAKASAGNGQIRYGADVINRIVEQGKLGGVKRLQDAILKERCCRSSRRCANRRAFPSRACSACALPRTRR
ncbi:MAG: hypothetical protein ACLU3I_04715 [Acutalibacteraceae bacterium]